MRELLKIELGAQRFQYWIDPLRILSADGGRVVIACTSRFERDKVVESHGERIANMISELAPGLGAVDFIVETRPRVVAQNAAASARATTLDSLAAPLVGAGLGARLDAAQSRLHVRQLRHRANPTKSLSKRPSARQTRNSR